MNTFSLKYWCFNIDNVTFLSLLRRQPDWCCLRRPITYYMTAVHACNAHYFPHNDSCVKCRLLHHYTKAFSSFFSQRPILLSSPLKLKAGISRLVAFFNPFSPNPFSALCCSVLSGYRDENERLLKMFLECVWSASVVWGGTLCDRTDSKKKIK